MIDNAEDDVEAMECDFIKKPKHFQYSDASNSDVESPVTPPNNSIFDSSGYSSQSYLYSMDHSSLRRIGCERNLFNRHSAGARLSSTTLFKNRHKLNFSLPNTNSPVPQNILSDSNLNSSIDSIKPLAVCDGRIPYEYSNPFTPDGKEAATKIKAQKRMKRLSIDGSYSEPNQEDACDSDPHYPERARLSQLNVSRFSEEFITVGMIGKGSFGCVYKCLNKLNGCIYAVKRTINPVISGNEEFVIRSEIYAHGVLDHPYIVRNFSCWNEGGFVYIQNEYCNGGNLEEYIKICDNRAIAEADLKRLLLQMARALRFIHAKGLAHMDVKSANIFLVKAARNENWYHDSSASDDDEDEDNQGNIIFKLGDLGHVISMKPKPKAVEEGDCRYLSREVLHDELTHLDRADVFSLGLTAYEAAGGGELPMNGEVWQKLRDGELPDHPPTLSPDLLQLIQEMIQAVPTKRPSSAELVKKIRTNLLLSPPHNDLICDLYRIRHSNTHLQQKTELSDQYLRALVQSQRRLANGGSPSNGGCSPTSVSTSIATSTSTPYPDRRLRRVVGKKTNRSSSTAF